MQNLLRRKAFHGSLKAMTVHDGSIAKVHGLHNLFIGYVASVIGLVYQVRCEALQAKC